MAFTPNLTPVFAKQPQANRVTIVNANGQTFETGYTAGANGSKVLAVIASSTDTSNRDIQMAIINTATTYILSTKTVPLASGTAAGTPAVSLLDPAVLVGMPVDNDGNPFLFLVSGDTLVFSALTSITTAKAMTIHVIAEDF